MASSKSAPTRHVKFDANAESSWLSPWSPHPIVVGAEERCFVSTAHWIACRVLVMSGQGQRATRVYECLEAPDPKLVRNAPHDVLVDAFLAKLQHNADILAMLVMSSGTEFVCDECPAFAKAWNEVREKLESSSSN